MSLRGSGATLAGRQVLYQSGVTLPPGRFVVKVVVRENTSGTIGSFEAPIVVPQLRDTSLKVSSVVLSTQLQPAAGGEDGQSARPRRRAAAAQPHARRDARTEGLLLLRGLRPGARRRIPDVRTSLAFYRGAVKVYETPLVERAAIDEPSRRAVVFQFEVPAGAFTPGTYTCQVNVIDAVAGRVAFPRLTFMVRSASSEVER